jgi:uncharacterized protein YhhL (DUF1145 family)
MKEKIYISPEDAKKVTIENAPKRPFPWLASVAIFIVGIFIVLILGLDLNIFIAGIAVAALTYGYLKQRE